MFFYPLNIPYRVYSVVLPSISTRISYLCSVSLNDLRCRTVLTAIQNTIRVEIAVRYRRTCGWMIRLRTEIPHVTKNPIYRAARRRMKIRSSGSFTKKTDLPQHSCRNNDESRIKKGIVSFHVRFLHNASPRFRFSNQFKTRVAYISLIIRLPLLRQILHRFFDICIPFLPLLNQAQSPLNLLTG